MNVMVATLFHPRARSWGRRKIDSTRRILFYGFIALTLAASLALIFYPQQIVYLPIIPTIDEPGPSDIPPARSNGIILPITILLTKGIP